MVFIMSTETTLVRLIRDREKGGRGYGGGGLYTCCYTVTTKMTPALRWAVMRTIKMFHCEGQSHKTVSTNHNLFEEKGEPKRNQAMALLPTSLTVRPDQLT